MNNYVEFPELIRECFEYKGIYAIARGYPNRLESVLESVMLNRSGELVHFGECILGSEIVFRFRKKTLCNRLHFFQQNGPSDNFINNFRYL